jgi:hypothetical protein
VKARRALSWIGVRKLGHSGADVARCLFYQHQSSWLRHRFPEKRRRLWHQDLNTSLCKKSLNLGLIFVFSTDFVIGVPNVMAKAYQINVVFFVEKGKSYLCHKLLMQFKLPAFFNIITKKQLKELERSKM